MDSADADNGSGNGVSGAHRNSREGSGKQRDGSRRFRAKSSYWLELGDARAHGVNDPPAAEVSSQRNRRIRRQDDRPVKFSPTASHVLRTQVVRSIKSAGHDSHRLLGIVAAMPKAVRGCGKELQLAKPDVNSLWSLIAQKPIDGHHERPG